jgi:predicted nucleic acid-binding protein
LLILPDTSCWIEFFRRHGNRNVQSQMRQWLGDDRLTLCGPVRAEVLRGARRAEAPRIAETFGALAHLDSTDSDWLEVATRARELADAGHAVPLVDLLIATIAQRHGVVLAHRDTHFRAIQQMLPVRTHDFLN